MINKNQRRELIKLLQERDAINPCARCGHERFSLASEIFNPVVQSDLNKNTLKDKAMPMFMTVCNHCGNINFHSLGALGLIDMFTEGN